MVHSASRFVPLVGGLIVSTVALASCSGAGESPRTASHDSGAESSAEADGSSREGAAFNNADVTFVQGMVRHHRGALAVAQLTEGRTDDLRVLDFARRIEAAERPEIGTMMSWLEEWGEPVPEESDSSMVGTGHDPGNVGGVSEGDMAVLKSASGAEFDGIFLSVMLEHHRVAVEMAETEIADGTISDAIQMAPEIVGSRSAEIEEMEALLTGLGG